MPRRKLSEYRAKKIVADLLGHTYMGWSVGPDDAVPKTFGVAKHLVVKVDQAVKGRFKKGLVFLNVPIKDVEKRVAELRDKGYSYVLIEPYRSHDVAEERYISFRRERGGVIVSHSRNGGVEVESHADQIKSVVFDEVSAANLSEETGLHIADLHALRAAFDTLHMTLFEINPYLVENGDAVILDAAIEVDSTAELLVDAWYEGDMRSPATTHTEAEADVRQLNNESPASFNLEVINPNGSIFLLLSGGGASVVIADEIFSRGHGGRLANYGEYSGNPTRDETARYAANVMKLLLASEAPKKVVLVGGAVANFTDISATFEGIIDVLKIHGDELAAQDVKFYVRRGGPRQAEGLRRIREALDGFGLNGGVYDPGVSIPEAVVRMLEAVE